MNKQTLEQLAEEILFKHTNKRWVTPRRNEILSAMIEMYQEALKGIDLDKVVCEYVYNKLPESEGAYNVWCEVLTDYQFPLIPEASYFKDGKWRIEEKVEGETASLKVHCWLKQTTLRALINPK